MNTNRPRMIRRLSTASDAESAVNFNEKNRVMRQLPTPSTLIASTSNMFPPPQIERSSSRRLSLGGSNAPFSPAPSSTPSISVAQESLPTPTTPVTHTSTPTSIFAFLYCMLFSIATMVTITAHDTQQMRPICMFSKLHYDEFTDMTWFVICYRL
ncbi:hypothetical protein Clacol_009037 [Clathrus columnatus]|uniref:Uncharacterized protein n=1 Tax=Clathrus columnatus TaxID=1419009 RepID=A0AAV5APY7_9AGAM|nr:hypothetical protein Clacol_009037 [Clathrus columnatus]